MRASIEHTLKCGCVLKHCGLWDSDGEADMDAAYRNLTEVVGYWLQVRAREHQCALVSEENPAGSYKVQERLDKAKK
jgi:hypothetical protein